MCGPWSVVNEPVDTVIPSLTPLLFRGDGWHLRAASTGDRAAMQSLLKEVHVGGALNLSEDRCGVPARLRVFEAQGTEYDPMSYIVEDEQGVPIGCLSLVVRPGRLGTDTLNICHISDIRIVEGHRAAAIFPAALQACCEDVRERFGVEIFFTSVFDQDHRALGALTHRDDRRYQQPMAQVMHQSTLSLTPLSARTLPTPDRRIERCSSATIAEVGELLARSHAMSTFGRGLSAAGFASRLHHATEGNLERIVMVREARGGALACCGLVLPTGNMRRLVLNPMHGHASGAARRFNLRRLLKGYPKLPIGKGPTSLLQLCFVAQRDDEPGPLRDLFLGVLSQRWDDDAEWLSIAVPRQGSAARAIDELPTFNAAMSLLAVTKAGTRWNNVDFRTQRCGVEHVFL